MRQLIFALAVATPAFAHAQTPADLAALEGNGAVIPAETEIAVLPVPGAFTAADLAFLQFPVGVGSHWVNIASAGFPASGMAGIDLARLSGRLHGAPTVIVRDVAVLNTSRQQSDR